MTSSNPLVPLELSVQQVQALRQRREDFVLLDCREPDEHALVRIEDSVLVPMSEIAGRLADLEPHRDRRMVVYCHHGGRSLRVVHWLRQQGYTQAQNMAGGIDQWSLEVDPNLPRY
jgi:rhodanese-related sulfurtransferase